MAWANTFAGATLTLTGAWQAVQATGGGDLVAGGTTDSTKVAKILLSGKFQTTPADNIDVAIARVDPATGRVESPDLAYAVQIDNTAQADANGYISVTVPFPAVDEFKIYAKTSGGNDTTDTLDVNGEIG